MVWDGCERGGGEEILFLLLLLSFDVCQWIPSFFPFSLLLKIQSVALCVRWVGIIIFSVVVVVVVWGVQDDCIRVQLSLVLIEKCPSFKLILPPLSLTRSLSCLCVLFSCLSPD